MTNMKQSNSFWTSYSDLMTSLFFVMLVLFIVCLVKVNGVNHELRRAKDAAVGKAEKLESILQLKEQFKVLSKSTCLEYDSNRKMFYAKDFQEKEIFMPFDDKIKVTLYETTLKNDNCSDKTLYRVAARCEYEHTLLLT